MSAWWEVPGGHINVDVLKRDASTVLAALKLAESVYRLNVVQPGEPSSVLDAMQAAIATAEGR